MSDCARLFAPPRRPCILRHTMLRIGLFALFAAVSLAQNNPFNTPPADVDTAWRARITPDFLFNQIKVNKQEVELWAGDSAEVVVVNTAPGVMGLSIHGLPEGIQATLDKPSLQAKETTVLKIKTAKDARPGTLNIQV